MPETRGHPLGGVLVLLLASWGEPFAVAAMMVSVALGAFSYKAWLARNAES